jgi:hypothetical protein
MRGPRRWQAALHRGCLVTSDPSLMVSENREALLEAVNVIYDQDHSVKITLTEQDLVAAEMMAARTDNLPKA